MHLLENPYTPGALHGHAIGVTVVLLLTLGGVFLLGFRAFELRATDVELDPTVQLFIRDCARRTVRLIANEPGARDPTEYSEKRRQILRDHALTDDQDFIFVEITVADPPSSPPDSTSVASSCTRSTASSPWSAQPFPTPYRAAAARPRHHQPTTAPLPRVDRRTLISSCRRDLSVDPSTHPYGIGVVGNDLVPRALPWRSPRCR